LIDRATHPDPAQRFQDVAEFRAHIAMLVNQAVLSAGVGVDAPKARAALKPRHLILIAAALMVISILLGVRFISPPAPPQQGSTSSRRHADDLEQPPEKKAETPVLNPAPVAAVPADEPPAKKQQPAPPVKHTVPVARKLPPQRVMPVTAPAPETPLEAIQQIEARDPELAQLVSAFGAEWSANAELDIAAPMQDLAAKYIPALQRSLASVAPLQRDFILSEISHIANREPLDAPDLLWPAVLKKLRNAYDAQLGPIQAKAAGAAQKMRAAQCALVLLKARERPAADRPQAAKLAETVAAELAKLQTAPSLRVLKQSAARTLDPGTVPVTAAEPMR
jgi:hypothetical protein